MLRGDCLAFGADGLPYAPIAAALRGLARELEPAAFEELVGPTGGDLARLLPELSATHRPDEPGEGMTGTGEALAQARLFGLLRTLLDRLAAESPVVFAVEDLHWADRSTLEFLSSLVRGLRDERLLLVCTYRSDELHRPHPLRPFLAEEERREVVERLAGRGLLAGRARRAGGRHPRGRRRPRPRRAAARALRGQRLLRRGAARRLRRRLGPLPSSLRDVLNLRLEALPDDARSVLRVAAAAGRRSGHRLLAAVARAARARAGRGAARRGGPARPRPGRRRLRVPPRAAAGGRLRRPAPGRADRAAPGARRGAQRRPQPRRWDGRRRAGRTTGAPPTGMPEALAAYVRAGLEAEQVFAFAEAGSTSSGRWRSGSSSRTPTSAPSSACRPWRPTRHRACSSRASTTARSPSAAWRSSWPTPRRRGRLGAGTRAPRPLPVAGGRQRRRPGRLQRRRARAAARPADARARARARGRGPDPGAPRPRRGGAPRL